LTTFQFYRFRFHFRAISAIYFPRGKSGNVLRGSFGGMLRDGAAPAVYARLFEPGKALRNVPSGLADWPRPFVFRAAHLDGLTIPPGSDFYFDLHTFYLQEPVLEPFLSVFRRIGSQGLGPGRGQATMERAEQLDLEDRAVQVNDQPHPACAVEFEPSPLPVERVRLRFETPTELKSQGKLSERPEFPIFFSRLRDRISTLRGLYGQGVLDVDFRALGERASAIRLGHCDLRWEHVERRSSRTGQAHPLGGFTGTVEYQGQLGEFLPWLYAARWVGVGRQTVWGKGEVRVLAGI